MTDRPAATEHDRTPPALPAEAGWVVWLRANPRPVWLATFAQLAMIGAAWAMISAAAGLPPWGPWRGLAVVVDLIAAGLAGAACATARCALLPRLERRGGRLRVRLAAGRSHVVPVGAVECFFLGSDPLAATRGGDAPAATHRVGTLVMRLAERDAERWRPATGRSGWPWATPWGRWEDGAIVLDGRWCERLSVEAAKRLSGLLIEARREELTADRALPREGVVT